MNSLLKSIYIYVYRGWCQIIDMEAEFIKLWSLPPTHIHNDAPHFSTSQHSFCPFSMVLGRNIRSFSQLYMFFLYCFQSSIYIIAFRLISFYLLFHLITITFLDLWFHFCMYIYTTHITKLKMNFVLSIYPYPLLINIEI